MIVKQQQTEIIRNAGTITVTDYNETYVFCLGCGRLEMENVTIPSDILSVDLPAGHDVNLVLETTEDSQQINYDLTLEVIAHHDKTLSYVERLQRATKVVDALTGTILQNAPHDNTIIIEYGGDIIKIRLGVFIQPKE